MRNTNTIGKEIQREAARKASLEGVKVGDEIFVGRPGGIPLPFMVTNVGTIYLSAGGFQYHIIDGSRVHKSTGVTDYITTATPETKELREAYEIFQLKSQVSREWGAFQAKPDLHTKKNILEILKAINPEAWK